ncbi:hypothetical protein B0T26DRAFT_56565 [Lasiosphaeria miniovina]|uniref:Uncharacterized protein n=1 Tax=Lasiosphaeria miniovina TaxID=1954250 RepID=A0AA40BH49_9PEZI|nr:uncharacterized protein B0T26DRAFT_56565 [Lasiosphaeria miniovina]KAK0734147.1 hypothetical protein B0T26DRAFT_56565 [Lasiosphaeria miniovina]
MTQWESLVTVLLLIITQSEFQLSTGKRFPSVDPGLGRLDVYPRISKKSALGFRAEDTEQSLWIQERDCQVRIT